MAVCRMPMSIARGASAMSAMSALPMLRGRFFAPLLERYQDHDINPANETAGQVAAPQIINERMTLVQYEKD